MSTINPVNFWTMLISKNIFIKCASTNNTTIFGGKRINKYERIKNEIYNQDTNNNNSIITK